MLDQIIIGDKASYDDFTASVASRKINAPKKKEIKETIPFSNKTYDFSAIDGEVYWEERELTYVFEIIAPTPELLENAKMLFVSWIMNVQEAKLIDPFIKDYHFSEVTYAGMDFDDDESIEKTTIEVTFTAYPYKVANEEKVYSFSLKAGETKSFSVVNNSAHRIVPTFTSDGEATVKLNETTSFSFTNEFQSDEVMLKAGANALEITNGNDTELTFIIKFTEEVF